MKRRRKPKRRRDRRWRGLWTKARALPPAMRTVLALAAAFGLIIVYQVMRKPTELLSVMPTSAKAPLSTWSAYGSLFREYSTDLVTPALLAALVQVESSGDPLARTYWRWRWSWNPLDLYAPASTAVGLLQITDGTFAEARHLCIRDHRVVHEGPWRDPRGCWLGDLYVRWIPSHAVEMTAAWLDQGVRETLGNRLAHTTPDQRRRLATVIHLCGRQRGGTFARRSFRMVPGERCGEQDVTGYVARVGYLVGEFERLAARD